MNRFGSVRFDATLGATERDGVARALRSVGARVTSWNGSGRRTYASLAVPDDFSADTDVDGYPDARVDVPPLAVLRVTPDARRRIPPLADALGGVGRPSGVIETYVDAASAVVVEFDPRRTSVALVVALVDAELRTAPGRRIEPLVAFDDATLVAYAAVALGIPDLSPARLIETYLA